MLPSANSWLGIARQGSMVIGPAVAAGVYSSAGRSTVWAIEAASFLVSVGRRALARADARGRVKVCFSAFGLGAVGIVAVALSPWYWLAAAAVVWRGAGIGVGDAAWMTLLTELVRERLLSRVYSLDFFGSSGLTPVGYALAAALATTVAPTTILAVGGTVAVTLWFAPLAWRLVREAD
jgi:MFS family permease